MTAAEAASCGATKLVPPQLARSLTGPMNEGEYTKYPV